MGGGVFEERGGIRQGRLSLKRGWKIGGRGRVLGFSGKAKGGDRDGTANWVRRGRARSVVEAAAQEEG
jgi:hypothetical protein